MSTNPEVSKEDVHKFLTGYRSIDRIVKIEGDYSDNKMTIFYRDENGKRLCQKEDFYPFLWCKQSAARQFFKGDRRRLKDKMMEYGIGCKGLRVHDTDGNIHPRMENGYRVLFFARIPMTYNRFIEFFQEAGRPIFPKTKDPNYGLRDYITVAPVEQFMIHTGYRMFKGYEDYNDLRRLIFDLETEGLEAEKHHISQIGVRMNNGFEKIIKIEGTGLQKTANEREGIKEFFQILKDEDPDVWSGYNSENFDVPFFDIALQERHNTSLEQFTRRILGGRGIYKRKKQQVLKLGGEMEYFFPTVHYGKNITDGLFAVRRAQAIDSNMKKADLKYVTKYSKINKPNRVYVPGKLINTTWSDTSKTYAFNDDNGHWFKVTEDTLKKKYKVNDGGIDLFYDKYTLVGDYERLIDNETKEEYSFVTGTYVVERYLLDDLWETDKIEYRYNLPNFLVCKMLPVQFDKTCTMGTAAVWKYLLLAWSYEHDLGIPELIDTKKFTGGLSRLLCVGYVDKIVKLDYNSLYPSILLTFNIKSPIDVMGVMLAMLEYVLSQREYYKGLKGEFGSKAKKVKKLIDSKSYTTEEELRQLQTDWQNYEREASLNDKLQLPLKILGNGFFGSYGSGQPFPHSDLTCAEETTCTGRMMLRLMISHFTRLGYQPIVGDSFTGDTPVFVKYDNTNDITIKPIEEVFDSNVSTKDMLGREYDTSYKGYKVLCRSGWVEPTYVYRHKTNKDIYEVSDGETKIEATEDHSLFDNKSNKISPCEISNETKLEYYQNYLDFNKYTLSEQELDNIVLSIAKGETNHVPDQILNADKETKIKFLELVSDVCLDSPSKTMVAGLNFVKKLTTI